MSKKRAGKIPALFVQLVQHIKLLGTSLVGVFSGEWVSEESFDQI
jgi:hypothetical protein